MVPLAGMIKAGELEANSGAILALCWNALLLMVLPLVLDWSERKYFKARFIALEELDQANPELKTIIEQQCEKLSIAGLRFATVDSPVAEPFIYGLWKQNPRLIVPNSWLSDADKEKLLPSIEVELTRFAKQDVTVIFLLFSAVQVIFQQVLLASGLL